MNTYIYHMLLRARELYNLNRKCPFCVADEDATWFEAEIGNDRNVTPHCFNCPLLSVLEIPSIDHHRLMGDCVGFGKELLRSYEERGDDV